MRKLTDADFVARYTVRPDGCWEWTGPRLPKGYGVFGRNGYAHRYSYERTQGPIPQGLEIDHVCRHPWCVNPEHLEAVTRAVNQRRGTGFSAQNAAKTHCVRGHLLAGANLRAQSRTNRWRQCRTCYHLWRKAQRAA